MGKHSLWVILSRIIALKTRTKLLAIFVLMFAGLFYANATILAQTRINNSFIESQIRIIRHQNTLSSTLSCFGTIKYWFAVLDTELKNALPQTPENNAQKGIQCDFKQFHSYLEDLAFVSPKAGEVKKNYELMQEQSKAAWAALTLMDDKIGGQTAINAAYKKIAEIDEGLGEIATKLHADSLDLSDRALAQSEEFKKFPILFLIFGASGIAMVSAIIFFSIFHPIENIISTMVEASQDPHNTKDYVIHRQSGRGDEMGEVIQALNSLLLQVHGGFLRTAKAEQEIAASARRLDAIFNSVADGLITVNATGDIESLNDSAYIIFGYDRETIKGKTIGDLFPPTVRQKYMLGIQDFERLGSSELINSGPKEMIGSLLDGGEIPIELSVTNIPLDDGQSVFVNVIRDITYRKDLERQLVQAQKMEALGSLSSGIAHEINTPTQYVRDNIKFLQDAFHAYDGFYKAVSLFKDAPPTDMAALKDGIVQAEAKQDIVFFSGESPQALAQALEGAGRISEIVGAIKGFSYPATEDVMYVDLNEALKNTIIVSRNQWKAFTDLKTNFDENLPLVPCIPGKLVQVILNLIVNATHAIEEKSHGAQDPDNNCITVSTSATKKNVIIKVADSGCGVPKENMTKIFNPFFTTKEVGKGTGQGLSISYDIIVRKHGGTLSVESEVGKGTTFIIELSLEIESVKTAAAKSGKATV